MAPRHPELRHLRHFVAVAEELNFTGAAGGVINEVAADAVPAPSMDAAAQLH